mmetsp:Transcript_110207/g.322531  ORF Transcript_110207/g.322531 Transcript_110207/m.322531 type:complete len:213 (-) Transcript_110207:1913-2551(-)
MKCGLVQSLLMHHGSSIARHRRRQWYGPGRCARRRRVRSRSPPNAGQELPSPLSSLGIGRPTSPAIGWCRRTSFLRRIGHRRWHSRVLVLFKAIRSSILRAERERLPGTYIGPRQGHARITVTFADSLICIEHGQGGRVRIAARGTVSLQVRHARLISALAWCANRFLLKAVSLARNPCRIITCFRLSFLHPVLLVLTENRDMHWGRFRYLP